MNAQQLRLDLFNAVANRDCTDDALECLDAMIGLLDKFANNEQDDGTRKEARRILYQ